MRKLGAWLAGIGILLAIGAGLSLWLLVDTDVGDAAAIESSLVPKAIMPGPTVAQLEGPEPSSVPEPGAEPLIQANETSRLEELAAVTRRSPIALRIDDLGVEAPIGAYGIDARTGQMDVPNNVREVGWYRHGPSPGEAGSAVLAAHVDLKSQGPGVFFYLRDLDPGALIVVTFDDGSEQRFQVKARNTYPKQELPLEIIFSRAGSPVLTLITCGGGFSASAESYDSNVVVYAVPVDNVAETLPLS